MAYCTAIFHGSINVLTVHASMAVFHHFQVPRCVCRHDSLEQTMAHCGSQYGHLSVCLTLLRKHRLHGSCGD